MAGTREEWLKGIEHFRKEKDLFLKMDVDSPLPLDEKKLFRGLRYFPPDEKYRIEVKLERYSDPEAMAMSTSKGTAQNYNKIGYFGFKIDENQLSLQVYKSTDGYDTHLFLPFRDKTSGRESYGAARYIDLDEMTNDYYALDFNYAYNPYCAYSPEYVCPLPPRENWLNVEIRAGEMKYP